MKGKLKQRVIASVMILLMTISLLPANFVGGGVQVKAGTATWEAGTYTLDFSKEFGSIQKDTQLYNNSSNGFVVNSSDSSLYFFTVYGEIKVGEVNGAKVMNTQGTTKTNAGATKRSVAFTIPDGFTAEVTAVFSTGSSNTERAVALYKSDASSGTDYVACATNNADTSANVTPSELKASLTEAGSYYITGVYGSTNNNASNIWSVEVVLKEASAGSEDAATAITPPTAASVNAQLADDGTVTITGTGKAGDEGSYYKVVRVDSSGAETVVSEKKLNGNTDSFEATDKLSATGKYTYKVYGTGKKVDDSGATNLLDDDTSTNAVTSGEVTYVTTLGKASPTAVAGDGQVTVSWSKVSEATSFDLKVYEGDNELTDKSKSGLTDVKATIEGLTNGTEYGFVVVVNRKSDLVTDSTTSDKATATPTAPEKGVTWLNANDLDVWSSSSDNYKVNDMWTIVSGGSSISVQSCDAVTTSDNVVFTQRISTGGSGSITDGTAKRAVQLTLTEKSYVVIYARSSGSSRPLVIAGSDGTAIETLTLAGKDDTVDPSRAISLEAGTYYFYTTGGTGYIYGIKAVEGEVPRADWSTVANPVINSVTRNDDGTVTVDFTASFGTDGADDGYVIMYQDGFEVDSQTVSKDGTVSFTPITEGTFTFKVIIKRSGEADKESEVATLEGYTLTLTAPTITWVNNLGGGSVYVDWNNVGADSYTVYYKSEGDAEYVQAAVTTAGNYTLTGLTEGVKYDIKVDADKDGLTSTDTASVTVGEAAQKWYVAAIGSATSGTVTVDGTEYSVKTGDPTEVESVVNTDKTVKIAAAENGKLADSEDGFFYYYTKIDPNTENFKLTATFTVTDTSKTPDNQTGYGVCAVDLAGFGTKDNKYFNSVAAGQYKMNGNGYHAHGARQVTGYISYDTANNAGATRNLDNYNLIGPVNESDSVNEGDTYTYTLEKTNEGYVCSMEGGSSYTFEGTTSLMVQEDGSLCVGVMCSRKVGVEISNIKFEKSEGSASASAAGLTTPSFKVISGTTTNTVDYEFIGFANVGGWLDVYDTTGTLAYAGYIEADTNVRVPITLNNVGGYNNIRYAFAPDPQIENLTSYQEISSTLTVVLQQWGNEGEVIYVSPNGGESAAGTMEDPLALETALKYAQPGQTIVMLEGIYYPTEDYVIPRGTNGTADKMISLVPLVDGTVIIDGSKMESSSSLLTVVGDYWHIYGIEFRNGLGKGVSVCGSNNIVEMCTIHNVKNTGLQISRYSGEPNDNGLWPSNNLIKYCEAYDCCDDGRNDADGFAAKLTVGEGNKFYGCISHNNIDDGWDLYAKSTTGSIGAVTIENCVAYSNGFLTTDDPATCEFGEGNGFKLGGENMPGAHKLINSITYNNAGKGVTSNSGPDCQVINVTAYNNSLKGSAYNVSLYTKTSNTKAWVLSGMLSIAENGTTKAELGASNGVVYSLRSASNYLYDGSKSVNTQGVEATSAWFVSTDISLVPTITTSGIDMHGLLELLASAPSDTGARFNNFVEACRPSVDGSTVSSKTTMQILGFTTVALEGGNGVNTGDTAPVMPLIFIMTFCAAVCGVCVVRRKRA